MSFLLQRRPRTDCIRIASLAVWKQQARVSEEGEKKKEEMAEFEKKYKIYTNRELAKFTPRELMLELKARGYTGDLLYQEVKVTEHRINLSKLE